MWHQLWLAIDSINFGCVKNIVEDLVLKGETVASVGLYRGDQTPVFRACTLQNKLQTQEVEDNVYNIVKLLVENKGEFHMKDNTGETCLMAAFFNKHFEVCKYLIDQGANVDDVVYDDENTLLHNQLQYCDKWEDDAYKIINLLVSKIDINKPNSIGRTYLMLAAELGDVNLCKRIIDRGADVNATCLEGYTALHLATQCFGRFGYSPDAEETKYRICELILESSTNPISQEGVTFLMRAVEVKNYKLCELLISKGVDLDVVSPTSGNTALHCALDEDDNCDISIIELLLKAGADPTICNKTGDDFLQHACLQTNLEVVQLVKEQSLYSDKRLVEAYKLIGSSLIIAVASQCYLYGTSKEYMMDKTRGVSCWRQALEIQEKCSPPLNNKSDGRPKLAFKNVHLFQKKEDLDGMESNLESLIVQALLIYYSILGPLHDELELAAQGMASSDCESNHRHDAFSRIATIEFKKLFMEIKLVKYDLDSEEGAFYVPNVKDYFLETLNEN